MDPVATAARFFAFTYYLNGEAERLRSPKEAGRYARGNWKQFLPLLRSEHFLNTSARGHKRPQKRTCSVEYKLQYTQVSFRPFPSTGGTSA
jgi:hypothetical protein